MERRSKMLMAVAVGVAVVAGAGASAGSARIAGNPCTELPGALRSVCVGPGVHCTVASDAHRRWETVFGTEPTRAQAEVTAKLAEKRGFGSMAIEADVRCSNGKGVYEVARARFTSHATAAALASQAKSKGFPNARTEDS
jgi:hypothetical protein